MNKNFWQEEAAKWKLCFLAPMDWYWDSAYRQTMRKISPHVYLISEFYSSDWLVHSKFLADNVLPHTKMEDPLAIQIFWKGKIGLQRAECKISSQIPPKIEIKRFPNILWKILSDRK